MAEKRMFAKSIVLSDAFLDMPMSARCLYFTLGMLADDDGFVGSPKAIMRQCGASQDDLSILLTKRYVLAFESGVIVIKHWRINNYLRQDRYSPTTYIEERSELGLDAKGAYIEAEGIQAGIPVGIPPGIPREEERSEDESSEDKGREDVTISDEMVCRPEDVRRVVEAWNTLGIQTIRKVPAADKTTGKMLRARIKEYGLKAVLEAVELVRSSDFLMGKATDWQITLEWFCRPNNFPKVINGNYENRRSAAPQTDAASDMQRRYQMAKDWANGKK